MKRYVASDVPQWLKFQLARLNYDKLTGTEIEKAASQLDSFARISLLKRKKQAIETVWYEGSEIPQSLLDTVSQIDWKQVSQPTQTNFENLLNNYIGSNYAGKLR